MRASGHPRGFILLPVVLALALIAVLAFELDRQSAIGVEMLADDAAMESARSAAEAGLANLVANAYNRNCPGAGDAGNLSGTAGKGSWTAAWKFTTASSVSATSTGQAKDATRTLTRTFDAYGQQSYTLSVVRPDPNTPGPVYDTFVAQDGSAYNFGADTRLIVSNSASATANVLLRFDLAAAGLPAKAKLRSAQLALSRSPLTITGVPPTPTLTVRKLTRAWDEGSGSGSALLGTSSSSSRNGANWGYATTTPQVAWSTPAGGQTAVGIGDADLPVDAQSVTVTTYAAGAPPQVTFDLTAPASEWIADPTTNDGVLVSSNDTLDDVPFYSSETATAAYRPTLTVSYVLPCGASAPPAVALAFASTSVGANTNTTLTATFSNPNLTAANAAAIVLTLPTGLSVAGTPTTTCGGSAVPGSSGGADTVALSGAVLPAGNASAGQINPGTCTLSVAVSPTAVGTYTVTVAAGDLTTGLGPNTAGSGASLKATISAPAVSKVFALGPDAWLASHVVVTLSNPNSFALSLTSAFSDNFPANVIGIGLPTSSCGGTVAWIGTAQGVRLSGASLPASSGGTPGTCTIDALVKMQPVGTYANTVPAGALQTFLGSNAAPATAVVMPDAADTWINGVSTRKNYGTSPTLNVLERSSNGPPSRALIRFDTSSIPTATVIDSARLRLYVQILNPTGAAVTLTAYAAPQAWVQGNGGVVGVNLAGANWTSSDPAGGIAWPVAGAVSLGTATPVGSAAAVPLGWIDLDVTVQAQAWITSGTNYGLVLVNRNQEDGLDLVQIAGRTSPIPPQLMVSY
jgi:hypothetical protein